MARKPSPQQKAAATRKANALFAKRSAAALKGWATRRRNDATDAIKRASKRITIPKSAKLRLKGKPNVGRKGVRSYTLIEKKTGRPYKGARYDFRGLGLRQRWAMRNLIARDAQGHYIRMLIATTNEAAYRRLTTSGTYDRAIHLARQDPGKPYWFWTPPFGPIESNLEAFDHMVGIFESEVERGEVRIMLVEIL